MAISTVSLRMPTPTLSPKPFLSYKLLSFDVYGTLVDWESGILAKLRPLQDNLPAEHPFRDRRALLGRFDEFAVAIQEVEPSLSYPEVLSRSYVDLARDLQIPVDEAEVKSAAQEFGDSVGIWPAFPDTISALQRLSKHYKYLTPLSNVDRKSFEQTLNCPLQNAPFAAYYLAEDIGTYKPDLNNFNYLIDHAKTDFGVDKDDILHVASALKHDHMPAKKLGIHSVWIAKEGAGIGGETEQLHKDGSVGYAWRFELLSELADLVEKEAAANSMNGLDGSIYS
jgi:2-haloalkanoic acid dehalogenase type II